MSTEDLLKRAALTESSFLAAEHVSPLEHDLYDSTHALATALRESERQLAEARQRLIDTERTMSFYRQEVVTASRDDLGRAGRIVELEAKYAESERQLFDAQDMAQACAAAVAPLAEACGVRGLTEEEEHESSGDIRTVPKSERVDALIGRVVSAAMAERRKT